jgi:hypothetical protein
MGNTIALLIVGALIIGCQLLSGITLGSSRYGRNPLCRRDEDPWTFWFTIALQVSVLAFIVIRKIWAGFMYH